MSKERATGRIDLMVAAVMGAGIALQRKESAAPFDDFLNSPIYA